MSAKGPRWWPILTVAVLYVLGLVWVWQIWDASSRQNRVMATIAVTFLLVIAFVGWLLLLSRLRWKTRLLGLLAIGVAGLALSQMVEVRGVYGDVIPIPSWKWSPRPHETLTRDLPMAPAEAQAAEGRDPEAPGEEVQEPSSGIAASATPQPITAPPSSEEVPATESPTAESPSTVSPSAESLTAESEVADSPPTGSAVGSESTLTDPATDPATAAAAVGRAGLDFPQFLGARRNATVEGVALARDWEASPPELVWRQPIGAGWSGFAVVGDCAVTLEQRGPEEMTICYELETGEVRWAHSDTTRFSDVVAGEGPRSTPTIAAGRVYTQGATGMLNVLDLATGARIWSTDIVADNATSVPEYGLAASPLILGDRVVVVAPGAPGGSLVAYDRATGAKLWAGGDAQGRYSSPTAATLAGREQILLLYNGAVRGHDRETGATLWEFPWPTATEETSQPLALSASRVYQSAGYGIGSKVFDVAVDGSGIWSTELVWEARSLKAKFTNVVVHDGVIYGLDDGILVAIDPATGERHWKRGRFGHGHVLLVGDLLLVLSEKGEVALVEPSPDEYLELARFQAIEGKTWNTPALAGPYLLVRNATEAACYRLPLDD